MLIELDIGEISITGLTGVSATQLRIATDDAIQALLAKCHLPTTLLENSMFTCDEITFQIDHSTSIQQIAAQIASNIVQQLV
jgi:hypothetical protein